jgi:HAMP domain-containing protein
MPSLFSKPFNFRWIIIISLVVFSIIPIGILQVLQILTVPQEFETQITERSKRELTIAVDFIRQSIRSDAEKVSSLAENSIIQNFITEWNNASTTSDDYDALYIEFDNFMKSYEMLPSLLSLPDRGSVLEIGIDSLIYINEATTFTNDNVTRLASMSIDLVTNTTRMNNNSAQIETPGTYEPYVTIKQWLNTKKQYTSSISEYTNLTTNTAILDQNDEVLPVNLHSHYIKDSNGDYTGILYVIFSAEAFVDVISQLDEPSLPAILIDQDGKVFYSSDAELLYTVISGYYQTIVAQGILEATVDPSGFEGEITIFQQVMVDWDQTQKIVVAKVIPRNYINGLSQNALINGLILIIVFAVLATLFALFTTRTITGRLNELTEAANKISRGKFDVEINMDGTDEITNLAKAFNRMSKSLEILIKGADLED